MSTEFIILKNKIELVESSALASLDVYIQTHLLRKAMEVIDEGWDNNSVPITIATNLTIRDLKEIRDRINYIIDCDTLLDEPKEISFESRKEDWYKEDNPIFTCSKCKSHRVKLQSFNTAIAKCEDCGYRWNIEKTR